MYSVWDSSRFPQGKPLGGDATVETLVIGGGMAGLLTAYELRKRGIEAVVMDAKTPTSGVTRYTTAKVTSQHGAIYARLLHNIGREGAALYAASMEQAIDAYEQIIEENQIACDWKRRDSFLYSRGNSALLEEELAAAVMLGLPATWDTAAELPFLTAGAVRFARQASFDPLQFLAGIAQDIPLWTHTVAHSINGHTVHTERGNVTAQHIVIATHFPFVNIPGWYFARMHQERHRVLALRNAPPFFGMYVDCDPDGLSFRQAGEFLLCGGEGRRTGKRTNGANLHAQARALFPQAEIAAEWWTQDTMTHDGLPLIGRFAASSPDWYVATGFNTWGMTSSMVAAQNIADRITGRRTSASVLFSPKRHLPQLGMRAFWKDAGQSVASLTAGLFRDREHRCPHLGCRMRFNEKDGVWECPCHGSVYTEDGTWLYGPATASYKPK